MGLLPSFDNDLVPGQHLSTFTSDEGSNLAFKGQDYLTEGLLVGLVPFINGGLICRSGP